MRRLISLFGAILSFLVWMPAAHADTVIRYSNWLPPKHFLFEEVYAPWFADVEKVTQGRVKFQVLPKVVSTPQSAFDVVRDGLADMSLINATYTPGRFISVELGELPLGGADSVAMSPAFDRTYRKHLEKLNEFAGVKVLSIFTVSPQQVFTAKKPINKLEDFRGLKMRAGNRVISDALTALGAVPLLKTSTETYEMLSAGTIDGQITLPNVLPAFGHVDLMKHLTLIPGGLANSVNLTGINQAKWDSISAADQKAIMAISGEVFARKVGVAYIAADERAMELLRRASYRITTISPDTLKQMTQVLKPVEDEWVSRAKAKGIADPASLLIAFRAEQARK